MTVSQAEALVEALKKVLRARKLNYAQVAQALKLSEATVKRMFSKNDFSLERFEEVCKLADVTVAGLVRDLDSANIYISSLTLDQEKEIVGNPKLLLVAVCALNHLTLEQMVDIYDLTKTECIQLLVRLDRIRFLELLPNNRIKLKVSRTFSWLPNGPIRRYFLERAEREYFRSNFDRENEHIAVINGMLSKAAAERMIARLRRLAVEFADLHEEEKGLPLGVRRPATLLLAMRPWELDAFHQARRRKEK
jgi:transcriptional regulator with XRE-family HTH domain